MMKTIDKKPWIVRICTCVILLFVCFYTYDFYKCLSGFIANEFHEPLVMLPMMLAFLLPLIFFFVGFYDCFVRAIHPVVKAVCAVLAALAAIAELVLIFFNISLYASNHALGVYDSLPGIGLHFPYDMIVILLALLAWQILLLAAADRKGTRMGAFWQSCKQRGTLRIRVWEYVPLCLLAFFACMFTGSAISAACTAFANAFYDARYVFVLLWFMLIPMANLVVLTLKPERMQMPKRKKLAVLGSLLAANVIFGLLFWILEFTRPDFMVYVGKPMLPLTFLSSLPIEPGIAFGIMGIGSLVVAVRMIRVAVKCKERA